MKSEIFFIVTTIAVAILTIGLCVIFYYVIKILRDINLFSENTKNIFQIIKKSITNNSFFKIFSKKSHSNSSRKK